MPIKKLRQKRGWSQEQLSEFTGLNVRTIQRIENGRTPSTESLKSLAAVFEVDICELQPADQGLSETENLETKRNEAIEQVENLKWFYAHIGIYLLVNLFLYLMNILLIPQILWFYYPAGFWLIGVVIHALWVFGFLKLLDSDWTQRQIDKKLKHKKFK